MESDPPDSRKRPLETPTEASSTKRTNTGGKRSDGDAGSCSGFGECCFVLRQAERKDSRLIWFLTYIVACYSPRFIYLCFIIGKEDN